MMWRSLLILALFSGLAAGSAIDRVSREKKTAFGPGLATIIGTLGLLKIKAIFVTLIVFAVAAIFTRLLGSGCGGGLTGDLGCGAAGLLSPTAHASPGPTTYSSYDQYGGAGGGYNYYNHRRSAKSIQGWNILDMSLEMLGLETEECKKKFVCLADNEALDNPLLQLFLDTLGSSLSRYRQDAVAGDSTPADAPGEPKNCEKLFPKCSKTGRNKPKDKLPRPDKEKDNNR